MRKNKNKNKNKEEEEEKKKEEEEDERFLNSDMDRCVWMYREGVYSTLPINNINGQQV